MCHAGDGRGPGACYRGGVDQRGWIDHHAPLRREEKRSVEDGVAVPLIAALTLAVVAGAGCSSSAADNGSGGNAENYPRNDQSYSAPASPSASASASSSASAPGSSSGSSSANASGSSSASASASPSAGASANAPGSASATASPTASTSAVASQSASASGSGSSTPSNAAASYGVGSGGNPADALNEGAAYQQGVANEVYQHDQEVAADNQAHSAIQSSDQSINDAESAVDSGD